MHIFHLPKILKQVIFFVLVLCLTALGIGKAESDAITRPTQTSTKEIFEVNLNYSQPKELFGAYIKGSNCSDLTGSIYFLNHQSDGILDTIRFFLGKESEADRKQIQKWEVEAKRIEGRFHCVPSIKNIAPILLTQDVKNISDGVIEFQSGLFLIFEKWNDPATPIAAYNYKIDIKILKIRNCSDIENIFCVDAEENGIEKKFRVLCWDCTLLKRSPDALAQRILFKPVQALSNGEDYFLDGGIMTNEDFLNPKVDDNEYQREKKNIRNKQLSLFIQIIQGKI